MGEENGFPGTNTDLGVAATGAEPSPYPVCIIPYEKFHVEHPTFHMSPLSYRTFGGFGVTPYEALKHALNTSQTAHTIVTNDGRILAFAGAWCYFRGVGGGCARVFTCVGNKNLTARFLIGIVRCMKMLIDNMQEQWQTHRIETFVAEFNHPALRLAQACGFEIESVMREYDLEHNNYYMMTRR